MIILLRKMNKSIFSIVKVIVLLISRHLEHIQQNLTKEKKMLLSRRWYGGINVALWTLLGDLTIEPTRPTALACASAVMWIFAWFSGFIPPYMQVTRTAGFVNLCCIHSKTRRNLQ